MWYNLNEELRKRYAAVKPLRYIFSSLVLVGGDGLYHEAVNGLMQKLAKEGGIDLDNPDVSFPEIQLRIGLIPCGK